LQIKRKIVSCHTANFKPVNQEANGTVILPPLVFPVATIVINLVTLKCELVKQIQLWTIDTRHNKANAGVPIFKS
jgi:hypothetical protein